MGPWKFDGSFLGGLCQLGAVEPDTKVWFSVQSQTGDYPRYSVVVRAPSDFSQTKTLSALITLGQLAQGQASMQIEKVPADTTFAEMGNLVLTVANGKITGKTSGGSVPEMQFAGPVFVTCSVPGASVPGAAVPVAVGDAAGEVLIADGEMKSEQCSKLKTFAQ
jgi:hypothetical protein